MEARESVSGERSTPSDWSQRYTSVAGEIRGKIRQIFIFGGLVFLSEVAGSPYEKIGVFQIELNSLTLGMLQAMSFLVIVHALFGILVQRHVFDAKDNLEQITAAAQSVREALNERIDTEHKKDLEWIKALLDEQNNKSVSANTLFNFFHLYVPIAFGCVALLFSVSDFVRLLLVTGWPTFDFPF
jgi:hypothetical protein